MKPILQIISEGETLTREQAGSAMDVMLRGEASPEQIAGLLLGLRSRGETLEELTGFTEMMRKHAIVVDTGDLDPIDLCGTGGDHSGTFNISTAASFVAAGAGIPVAKHGNKAVSSSSGSADVLDALGVRADLEKEGVERVLQETGITFLFAPQFHPALKHVMPVRRALGVRTFFNILGPMCNPAGVKRQLIGAFSKRVAKMMSGVLRQLGSEHVVVVYGHDGLDELSTTQPTTVYEAGSRSHFGGKRVLHGDSYSKRVWNAEDFGLDRVNAAALQGGTPEDNAEIVRSVLGGTSPKPQRDIVLFNAAFALYASAQYGSPYDAMDAAEESIDSGNALQTLERFTEATNDYAHSGLATA